LQASRVSLKPKGPEVFLLKEKGSGKASLSGDHKKGRDSWFTSHSVEKAESPFKRLTRQAPKRGESATEKKRKGGIFTNGSRDLIVENRNVQGSGPKERKKKKVLL